MNALKLNKRNGFTVSYMGAFCSVIFVAIFSIQIYTILRPSIDANSEPIVPNQLASEPQVVPTTIISNLAEGALTSANVFSAKQGLFFAVSLSSHYFS